VKRWARFNRAQLSSTYVFADACKSSKNRHRYPKRLRGSGAAGLSRDIAVRADRGFDHGDRKLEIAGADLDALTVGFKAEDQARGRGAGDAETGRVGRDQRGIDYLKSVSVQTLQKPAARQRSGVCAGR